MKTFRVPTEAYETIGALRASGAADLAERYRAAWEEVKDATAPLLRLAPDADEALQTAVQTAVDAAVARLHGVVAEIKKQYPEIEVLTVAMKTVHTTRSVRALIEFVCPSCGRDFFVKRDLVGDRRFGPCKCGATAKRYDSFARATAAIERIQERLAAEKAKKETPR